MSLMIVLVTLLNVTPSAPPAKTAKKAPVVAKKKAPAPKPIGTYKALKKGQRAPFAGTLLDPAAIAYFVSKTTYDPKACKIEKQQIGNAFKLRLEKVTALAKSELDHTKKRCDAVIGIKDQQLKATEGLVRTTKRGFLERFKTNSFWTGLAIGVGASFVLSLVAIPVYMKTFN